MRFLIDAQLPPALAEVFLQAGHEAAHVFGLNLLSGDDRQIAAYAAKAGMVIVTKDEDFVLMRRFARALPPVVWVRTGNSTNRALTAILKPLLPQIVAALESGETIVEVR